MTNWNTYRPRAKKRMKCLANTGRKTKLERIKTRTKEGLIGIVAAAVLAGTAMADKKTENNLYFLTRPAGLHQVDVKAGNTYWDLAKQLQEENDCLARQDTRDVVSYLQEINNNNPLRAGDKINLPEYDCRQ